MDTTATEYWNYEAEPRGRVLMGDLHYLSEDSKDAGQATGLIGHFEGTQVLIDQNASAILATTLIGRNLAIALRVYTSTGALCWLFAPNDPEATRTLSAWLKAGKVKLTARFGSGTQEAELALQTTQVVDKLLQSEARDPYQVQRLCDFVAIAESDGLLNSLAFVPMTRAVESQRRRTCLVASSMVSAAFKCRN